MNTLLSAFGGGLWFIPLLTAMGTAIFSVQAVKESKAQGKTFVNTGYGKFALGLLLATIAIIIWMWSDR